MKYKFLLIFCFFSPFTFSQNSKIEYYTFTKNTVDTTGIRSYLLYNENKSLFVWNSIKQKTDVTASTDEDDDSRVDFKKTYNDTIGTRVLNHYRKDTLILREPLMENNLTVIDKKPHLDWNILNEFKEIGGIQSQKAIANFRGRTYMAWFAQSIPVPTGPWKLCGLPGLILEAYDENNEVNFLFKSLTQNYSSNEQIKIQYNETTALNLQEFVEEKDNTYREIMERAISKLPRGTTVTNNKKNKRFGLELNYEWEMETKED